MTGGYVGIILRVNLTEMKITEEVLGDEYLKKYIGGSGIGTKILFDETDEKTDPLGPDNVLIFMTGPLTGTAAINSGRHQVISKSPLSGIFGESSIGGGFGAMLKKAGYDGVVINGTSKKPVYIWINEGKAEIRDAANLWGKDTYDIDSLIKAETHPKAIVTSIGQAGENMTRIACIMSDGKNGRAAGRCGLGAVMGSKKLKAVVAYGSRKIAIANKDTFMKPTKELGNKLKGAQFTSTLNAYGTAGVLNYLHECGDTSIKNWQMGGWIEGAKSLYGEEIANKMKVGSYGCAKCIINCGQEVKISKGKFAPVDGAGPEYETLGVLGLSCLIDDVEAIAKANELCNRYGLDTIETGNAVAFTMEAFERKMITREDLDGLEMVWGNAEAMVKLVDMIGKSKGFGEVLGRGLLRAADYLGPEAHEFAMHTRGVALPAHDPRARFSSAIGYAVSPIGASHVQATSHDWETPGEGKYLPPELGYDIPLDRFQVEGKGILTSKLFSLFAMYNSLCLCFFALFGGENVTHLVTWLNGATGWDLTIDEFLKTGKRIFTLKRLYNIRCGLTRKDDILPPRILLHATKEGGSKGKIPPLNLMLSEFYEHQGWDEFGRPKAENVLALGLNKEALQLKPYK